MGSPVSPIVANLYMKELENKALEAAKLYPRMWVRYIDNTFVLWLHGEQHFESFHQHLNSQHPAIQFTMEREQQNRIAFLVSQWKGNQRVCDQCVQETNSY